jgi:hypothetical protein
MRRGQILLEMLLLALATHGLGSEGLDPWRGWVVFKQFARAVAEAPDPGVSVQITRDEANESVSMVFVHQVVDQVEDWLEPTSGVVCEFTFPIGPRRIDEWEAWSFEAASFDRFVDLVEENSAFQDLIVSVPGSSAVYWLEA